MQRGGLVYTGVFFISKYINTAFLLSGFLFVHNPKHFQVTKTGAVVKLYNNTYYDILLASLATCIPVLVSRAAAAMTGRRH